MTFSSEQMRFWSPEVRELEPYVAGEQPKSLDILKLNTNENPYPPSPSVVEAIQSILVNQAEILRLYPDPESSELKRAIAEQQHVEIDQVFVGNGSDEVLAHIFKAFFVQPEPLLYPDITYAFYPVYCQYFGVKAQPIPLNENFEIDIADYRQSNGGIIIANPNAPTGIALSLHEIEVLLKDHSDRVVVIDEAYVDFGAQSAVQLIKKYDNLVVCHTTSKSRSLAGLRVGYAIAQKHLIAALETVKNSFNSYPIDRFAVAAAIASFQDQTYFDLQCQKVIASREVLVEQLEKLGFKILPSKANFIFITHPQYEAEQLSRQLRERNIIVRYFNKPRIDQFLRVTVGTDEQNQQLLAVLKQLIV